MSRPNGSECRMTGKEFHQARDALGMSLNDIVKWLGVDQSTVLRWQTRSRVPGPVAVAIRGRMREQKREELPAA